jgi:hypothetical protein
MNVASMEGLGELVVQRAGVQVLDVLKLRDPEPAVMIGPALAPFPERS